MIDDDSPYFRIVDAAPISAAESEPGEIARGDGWSVVMSGDVPMLRYHSGEHGGGMRRIAIRAEEVDALRNGETTLDEVLIAHNAS